MQATRLARTLPKQSCWVFLAQEKVAMLVTLVAVLCNGPLCLEKIVTTSEQSGITMTACQVNAQIGLPNGSPTARITSGSCNGTNA
jgi:hypothetical protein